MLFKQPKKMLIIYILDILKRYSDEQHPLNQKDIIQILEAEYDMTADRKAVKRNLMNLVEFGCNIKSKECRRINRSGEEEVLYTKCYLDRDFSDNDLRLIIDSLVFSKSLTVGKRKSLIKKIESLSSKYFHLRTKNIASLGEHKVTCENLYDNLNILDKAIEAKHKVRFNYNSFGTDKRLHPRLTSDGHPRIYDVSPYKIAASNGFYYIVCNNSDHENVSYYRVDRITDLKLTDNLIKPQNEVKGIENGLNLPKLLAEHIYMFSGPSEKVKFRLKKYIIGDIIDWFGCNVRFSHEAEGEITAEVTVNLRAMRYWALQYSPHIQILEPAALVEQITEDIVNMSRKYGIQMN